MFINLYNSIQRPDLSEEILESWFFSQNIQGRITTNPDHPANTFFISVFQIVQCFFWLTQMGIYKSNSHWLNEFCFFQLMNFRKKSSGLGHWTETGEAIGKHDSITQFIFKYISLSLALRCF